MMDLSKMHLVIFLNLEGLKYTLTGYIMAV